MTLSVRLARLETRQGAGGQIPVWCDDIVDMPATIDAMVVDGEMLDGERLRLLGCHQCRAPGTEQKFMEGATPMVGACRLRRTCGPNPREG